MSYSKWVPAPSPGSLNGGLSSPSNTLMLELFGVPSSSKSQNCAPPTNPKIKRLLVTRDVGPFNVTGIVPAVESLTRIFNKVKVQKPRLYNEAKTAGMLCCRLQRGSSRLWSNHSFGTAIDLYFGTGVVPRGEDFIHQGVLELYPFFHNEGWYSGAEFSVCDAMHFEVATETLRRWEKEGKI